MNYSKLCKYFLNATAASIGWLLIKCVMRKIKLLGTPKEHFHEVLFFNEMCHSCVHKHMTGQQCQNVHCIDRQVKRMQQMIDKSKYSIDLAIYSLSTPEMIDALYRALSRGIKLRLIINETCRQEMITLSRLRRCGACVRKPPMTKHLMHHKFCVIDGHKRVQQLLRRRNCDDSELIKSNCPLVMSGSANWTNGDLYTSYNSVIISTNSKLAAELEAEFCRLWRELKNPNERDSYVLSP
ncbi:mitochondrial cardiolipin hydrolase-like [Drosophila albomicans]|uniref:Mitochondrial cardiolipin hydrolase n=1 Tax=Drosophila albomicans TaxID=7291 RepID=A0A6P8Z6U4_DROAB|nr:mitochondrial cardiolipin hydrolase-like [Drosophila albomicans]